MEKYIIMSDFLEQLNPVQREAVLEKDGASLVIAGAGSGKTRVLTYRIAYLLSQGVAPYNILALTFTNKAANEMKERIGKLVGYELAHSLWMGTFHSVFGKILRYECEHIGFPSSYTIYDTTDSKSLVKSIVKQLKLDDKVYKPNTVLSRISMAKNNLITANAYAHSNQVLKDRESKIPEIHRIYQYYAGHCMKSGAMDFDDLLLYTNILLHNNPDVLAKYQDKFKYILVDEYQDTNFAQYMIVKMLSAKYKNICVVGDDAQSIYSFRGAKIENILNFKNDYPDYHLFKLEQNYRSTQNIVCAANFLIKKNENQIPKEVFSENDKGELIKVIPAYTDKEEGYLIANDIFEQIHSKGLKYSDIAILYRTNMQSRIMEESLRKRNMPYKIYGGLSFYQRKEIKDLIAYLRLLVNPKDSEAFKRVINYPVRGIGQTTLSKVEELSNTQGISMWEVISTNMIANLNVNGGTQKKLRSFVELMLKLQQKNEESDAYDTAHFVASETGILKELRNGKTVEDRARHENLEELLNGIRDFVTTNYANEGEQSVNLTDYLENVALLTDQDNEKEEDRNKITMMTIHSSKGLEFPQVYVVGLEEGLFPSKMSIYDQHNLEEERRLFYVAMTRAERRLTLSYARSRYKYGTPENTTPSRFLKDLDPSLLDQVQTKIGSSDTVSSNNRQLSGSLSNTNLNLAASRKLRQMKARVNTEGFKASSPLEIIQGANVEHIQFGKGKVVSIEGEGQNKKATVFFSGYGEKKLLLRFAKLRVVD